MAKRIVKYFIKHSDHDEQQVDKATYIMHEHAAGFKSKFKGPDQVATASFNSSICPYSGHIEYSEESFMSTLHSQSSIIRYPRASICVSLSLLIFFVAALGLPSDINYIMNRTLEPDLFPSLYRLCVIGVFGYLLWRDGFSSPGGLFLSAVMGPIFILSMGFVQISYRIVPKKEVEPLE